MEELQEVLARLERMESKIDQLATREEVQRVADTLESIATGEVAAAREKLEDRDDARDVLLKSLIDGLENRITGRFDGLAIQVGEGFKMLAKNQEMTLKLLRQFGRELRELEERVDELGA